MLKLKNINESFEKLYDSSLNESISLTEAFNESFPKWLKQGIILSRNSVGEIDRSTGKRKNYNWSKSNYPTYKDKRNAPYKSDKDKSLWGTALQAGFFNVQVHESPVPAKPSDVPKEPYIPIWGFPNGQVYIPGFNDLEHFKYYVHRHKLTGLEQDYSKLDDKAFENFSGKALREYATHFAWFDATDLDPQAYESIKNQREAHQQELQQWHKEDPNSINLIRTPKNDITGSMTELPGQPHQSTWDDNVSNEIKNDIDNYELQKSQLANDSPNLDPSNSIYSHERRYSDNKYHYDKSGYLVNPLKYEQKLKGLRGRKLTSTLEQMHEDIIDMKSQLVNVLRSRNIWDLGEDDSEAVLEYAKVILERVQLTVQEYNSFANLAQTTADDSSLSDEDKNVVYGDIVKQIRESNTYLAAKRQLKTLRSLLGSDVSTADWLV